MKRGWRGNEKSPSRDHHESCLGGFSKYSTCVHACTHAHAHAPQFGLTRERPGGSGCRARPREPRRGRGLALPLAWSLCTRSRARRLRSQSQRSPHTHSWHGPGRAGAWGAPSRSTHGGPERPAGVVTTQLPISPLPQQDRDPAPQTAPCPPGPHRQRSLRISFLTSLYLILRFLNASQFIVFSCRWAFRLFAVYHYYK